MRHSTSDRDSGVWISSIKPGEAVKVGDDVVITYTMKAGRPQLQISAPRDVRISKAQDVAPETGKQHNI